MNPLIYVKEIWRGKDTYRILFNLECSKYELIGEVLDVGSGRSPASYHRFFRHQGNFNLLALDSEEFSGKDFPENKRIDLEKDRFPHADESIDIILAMNVLEHIYNYDFLISEMRRVLKSGGKLIGVVPFLTGYHPDPHDYWRYTNEALRKIFARQGFNDINIKPVGYGPLTAAFYQSEIIFPRVLKMIFLPLIFAVDYLVFKIRPNLSRERFALGLFFTSAK